MKKRILALTMTIMMACALVVEAGAAPVGSAAVETAPVVAGATAADGTVIPAEDVAVTPVQDVTALPAAAAAQLQEAYQQINSAADVVAFISNAGLTSEVNAALAGTSTAADDLSVHSIFDVSASGQAAAILAADGSVNITFTVPGVKTGDAVVALHFNGTTWDVRPCTVRNGAVVVNFDSLSPVVIMVEGAAAPSGTVTSPQTSDVNFEGVLFCGALLCAAALAYSLKRRQTV